MAQAGVDISLNNLSRPTALPNLGDGFPAAAAPGGGAAGGAISAASRAKYDAQFGALGPVNGFVTGAKARDLFTKSGLPNDKLSQIWQLSGVCAVLVSLHRV